MSQSSRSDISTVYLVQLEYIFSLQVPMNTIFLAFRTLPTVRSVEQVMILNFPNVFCEAEHGSGGIEENVSAV